MNIPSDLPQRIVAACEFERRINLHRFPIQVRAADGSLIVEGHVQDVSAKRLALRIARELAGAAANVVDALDLVPAVPRPDGAMLDAFTQALLECREFSRFGLRRHRRGQLDVVRAPDTDGAGQLEFAVRDGVVGLDGTVPSLAHRRLAEALAWWIAGCRNVINRLRVDPPERDGDDELADAVALVLEIDPTLPDSQPLGVEATFGVVTLRGTLRGDAQRARAERDAWCVDGVHEVRNAIEVRA